MQCTTCSQQLKPILVTDIDGTLGDYHGHFFSFADLWLGTAANYSGGQPTQAEKWKQAYDGTTDLATFMGLDKKIYRAIKLAYRQGGMKRCMPAHLFAQSFLRSARRAGCEIWIATTRPYNRLDNIDPDTQEFLRRAGLTWDHLVYGEDKYDEVFEQIDVGRVVMALEDLHPLCEEADALGFQVVQFRTRYNAGARWPVGVHGLQEATAELLRRVTSWEK